MDDLAAFNKYHWANFPAQQRSEFFLILFSCLLGVLLLVSLWLREFWWVLYFAGLLMISGISWKYRTSKSFYKKFYTGKDKGMIGEIELTISSEGIFEKSEAGDTKIKWSGVEKIEQNEQYVFVYIGSLMAYVIPKRTFPNESALQEFYSLLNALRGASRVI